MSNNDNRIIPTLDDVIKPGDLDKAVIGDLNSFDDSTDDSDDDAIELFTESETELDDTFDNEFNELYAGTSSPTETAELEDVLLEPADDETVLLHEMTEADYAAQQGPGDDTIDDTADDSIEIALNTDDITNHAMLDTELSALEETPAQFHVASEIENTSTRGDLDDDDIYDNHDDLADLIVAESFPQDDAVLHASIEEDSDDLDLPDTDKPRNYDVASWGEPVVKFDQTADNMAAQAAAPPATSDAPATHATEASLAIAAEINVGALVDDITKKLMPEIEWKIRMRLREVLDEIFPEK